MFSSPEVDLDHMELGGNGGFPVPVAGEAIRLARCEHEACALVSMHDLGGIARTRPGPDGKVQRGFALYVGGGLGAVPHQAKLFDEFLPEEELLPTARAIGRVFARMGEKKNRNRARLKFLVQKLGIDEFRRIVQLERLPGLHGVADRDEHLRDRSGCRDARLGHAVERDAAGEVERLLDVRRRDDGGADSLNILIRYGVYSLIPLQYLT